MNVIERHEGKIVLRTQIPAWWVWLYKSQRATLWLLQVTVMSMRTYMMFGVAAFFVLWISDIGYVLWIGCLVVMVFSVAITTKIVLYIKRERGVR